MSIFPKDASAQTKRLEEKWGKATVMTCPECGHQHKREFGESDIFSEMMHLSACIDALEKKIDLLNRRVENEATIRGKI